MAARDAFAVTDQEIVNALAGSFLPHFRDDCRYFT
jgi:hypothetical protein